MFPIASTTALITSTSADLGVGIAATLAVILAAWAALHALGYFTRKASNKVTGKKF